MTKTRTKTMRREAAMRHDVRHLPVPPPGEQAACSGLFAGGGEILRRRIEARLGRRGR